MKDMNILEEYHERRNRGNEKISSQNFLPYNRFFALDSRAYDEGEIPSRYKELIGLCCSAVMRCNDCILYHLERCIEQGCTPGEINEALNIAQVIGGSIVIPHLRYAIESADEVFKIKLQATDNIQY